MLEEEMRRSVRFFGYFRKKWREDAIDWDELGDVARGAYARKYVLDIDMMKSRSPRARQAHRYVELLLKCRAHYGSTAASIVRRHLQTVMRCYSPLAQPSSVWDAAEKGQPEVVEKGEPDATAETTKGAAGAKQDADADEVE